MRVSSPDAGLDTPAIDLLARLVAFDTVSARSNLALIEAVAAYLREHAVACETVFSDDGAKAGLIASIGPDAPGGIVLSGHTDVVPVEGQVWSSDPFTLVERDGRLFGRGAADMKGFIATALALVPAMTVMPLRVPIHLALSWDEEVGCLGAPRLLAALLARVPKPGCVIVGEPTGMRVADRHRGISTFVTTVRGRGGHSSAPHRGVNAIGAGARIVAELERIGQTLATGRPAADDETPEHTTVNVGRIDGGAAVNMIAEHCRIAWECRPAPGSSADDVRALLDRFVEDDLLPPMRAAAAEAAVSSEEVVSVPPLLVRAPSPAVALALRLSGQNRAVAAPFASEAGLFQAAGVPAVVIGPGWPAQAHQPDEFVSREQITACLAFLRQLADWASHYPETASDSP